MPFVTSQSKNINRNALDIIDTRPNTLSFPLLVEGLGQR